MTRSLTTHDEIMAEIEKSSAVESRAAAAMDSASLPGGLGVGVSAAAAAAAAAATAASSSPLGALPGDLAAGAMVSPGLLALATGCIGVPPCVPLACSRKLNAIMMNVTLVCRALRHHRLTRSTLLRHRQA